MNKPERSAQDPDADVLNRVVSSIERKDFFNSVLVTDSFDDWNLARDLGTLLVRIMPEEFLGHALLARAYRHLGKPKCALAELARCRLGVAHPAEKELFLSLLADEDRLSPKKSGRRIKKTPKR